MTKLFDVIRFLWWSSIVTFVAADDIAKWCGKVYKAGDPYIPPTGGIDPPTLSKSPLLNLKIQQRYSPYLEEDASGVFVIDTSLSYISGQPWRGSNDLSTSNVITPNDTLTVSKTNNLLISIRRSDTGRVIAQATVPVNASDNQVSFQWGDLSPSLTSYGITVMATGPNRQRYTANTQLQRLPTRTDGGSVVKIDNLYGSLVVKNQSSNAWQPLLPYSFYLDSNWVAKDPASQLAQWVKYGYNVMHVIPPYDLGDFTKWAQEAEKLGLWIMYNMRHTYQDLAQVTTEVNMFSNYSNILLWYTADEPDGWQNPLDSSTNAYNTIKKLDPYHPVSLALNCQNYHFQEYTAGADIILTDPYPIGLNTTWSDQYQTEVNTTYGDSGCDNCYGYNDLTNLPSRLASFRTYQTQLNAPWQKPLWGVPQAFGNQAGWKRVPTADELTVMSMLYLNHGAKGILNWVFETSTELEDAASKLAMVLTTPAVAAYVLGGQLVRVMGAVIDVAAWMSGDGGSLMVSIVNPGRNVLNVGSIDLTGALNGGTATGIGSMLWGDNDWKLSSSGTLARTSGVPPLSVDLFTVTMKGVSTALSGVALVGPGASDDTYEKA